MRELCIIQESESHNHIYVMTTRFLRGILAVCSLLILSCMFFPVHAQTFDFNVLTPDGNYFYTFNDDPTENPGITLVRGRTYTFNINTDFSHPFQILPEDGVDNNNINFGVITYQVPADAQDSSVIYQCSVHGFGNLFSFVDPVLPPIQLLSVSVSTNLVLLSTGASETNLFPEFSTDLSTTNWYALTVTSNRFFGGTNGNDLRSSPRDQRVRSHPCAIRQLRRVSQRPPRERSLFPFTMFMPPITTRRKPDEHRHDHRLP